MNVDEKFMQAAIDLARQARHAGNHPFGALLELNGRVLLTAQNTVNAEHDVTRHAELNLVSLASQQLDADTLAAVTLYTSTEPCAMCAGAIYWAGIRRIVFGCSGVQLGQIAGGEFVVPSQEVFAYGKTPIIVVGPVLTEQAAKVHAGFWV